MPTNTPPRKRRRLYETRTVPAWGVSGQPAIPADRHFHPRETAKDKRTGETYEVKRMRALGDVKLTARVCSRDKHGQLINGYTDKIR